jgi:hypothetical protein
LQAERLIKRFGQAYPGLMTACEGIATEYYGSIKKMHRSIAARAEFENRPLSDLYRRDILRQFTAIVDTYKSGSDPEIISRTISGRIAASDRKLNQPE